MTKKRNSPKTSIRTQSIHGEHLSASWEFSHHLVPPLTASTTFRLESLKRGAQGFSTFTDPSQGEPIWIYDRLEEPTTKMLEQQLAQIEMGECSTTFASGMAAISSTLLSLLKTQQSIVAHKTLYGCTYSLLTEWMPKYGIHTTLIDITQKTSLKDALKNPQTRVVYFESVSNPILEIADLGSIKAIVDEANKKRDKENKVFIVVDNTFATPWALRPLEHGADFVIQSLTKNISGFGTEMGGAVICKREHETSIKLARKDFGGIIHPYSAWHILVYGIATQAMRFEAQQTSALKIANYLENHPKVERVIYPGLKSHPQHKLAKKYLQTPEGKFAPGYMISFTLKGNMKKCEKFVDDIAQNAYSITLAVSLGLVKTLIEVPGYMTHSAIPDAKKSDSGIDPRGIRLSIGLESVEDIIQDLEKALAKI